MISTASTAAICHSVFRNSSGELLTDSIRTPRSLNVKRLSFMNAFAPMFRIGVNAKNPGMLVTSGVLLLLFLVNF